MGLSISRLKGCLVFSCLLAAFAGCSSTIDNSSKLKAFAQADSVVAMVFALDGNDADVAPPQPKPDDVPNGDCTNCHGTGKSGDGLSICTVCRGTGKTEWKNAIVIESDKQVAPTTTRSRWRLFRGNRKYVPQRKSYSRPSSCSNGTCK